MPASGKVASLRVDHLLLVEENLEVIAEDFDRQLMPLAGGDLAIPARQLSSSPIDHVTQPNVVFQRVARAR